MTNQIKGVCVINLFPKEEFGFERTFNATKKQINAYIIKIKADKSIAEYSFKSLRREKIK